MMDSSHSTSLTDVMKSSAIDNPAPGSLEAKQAQLDQIAQALVGAAGEGSATRKMPIPESSGIEELPNDMDGLEKYLESASSQGTLREKLAALAPPVTDELDWQALESRLSQLASEMEDHSHRVLDTQVFDRFQTIELDGRPLADLTADDIQSWIQWYKEQGNFQAAEILAQAYSEFVRELNQKALDGHLFQEKQLELSAIQSQLEWRDVERAYLERVPELAPYAKDIRQAVQDRLMADPLSRFTNKYVLVRDAIESLGVASEGAIQSPAVTLPPDASVQSRRIPPSSVGGKKSYRLSDLRAIDYRALSSEDLRDLQNAMFEGRIQE